MNKLPHHLVINNVGYDLYYAKGNKLGYQASLITKNIIIFYTKKTNLQNYMNKFIQNVNHHFKAEHKPIYVFSPIENKFIWFGGKKYKVKFIYKNTKMKMYFEQNIVYFVLKPTYQNLDSNKLHIKILNLFKQAIFQTIQQQHNNIKKRLNINDELPIKLYKRLSFWGSYKYNLALNKKEIHYSILMCLTPKVFWDSVIIHELTHHLFPNQGHSAEFKQFCKKHDENYDIYQSNNQVPFWVYIDLDLEIKK
ncbi:DUF45 domain-containing protein [Mycoplasmopsis phocirhinis]|uniref:DUF45 domain-containing protein n=1 Tax=Mycoplasmopsis phocirhinis TaxID=142650 RepID=A0A4P6MP27_9BACT|nr:YgjP-like metallopeptidase domain-containing protein [Mycoplasmopsis phocirhinis]QBF34446.1 DUF45 domain-containing protein [Mycoplasmopsis phocirhinis]